MRQVDDDKAGELQEGQVEAVVLPVKTWNIMELLVGLNRRFLVLMYSAAVLIALVLGFVGAWHEQVDQSAFRIPRALLAACSNLTLQYGDMSPQRHWASIAASLLSMPIFAGALVLGAMQLMLPQYMRARLRLAREHIVVVGIDDDTLQTLGQPDFDTWRSDRQLVLVDKRIELLALARERLGHLAPITIHADASSESAWDKLRVHEASMVVVYASKLDIVDAFLGSLPKTTDGSSGQRNGKRRQAFFRIREPERLKAFQRLILGANVDCCEWELLPFDERLVLFRQALEMYPPDAYFPAAHNLEGAAVLRLGFFGGEEAGRIFLRELALVAHYPGCREVRVRLFGDSACLAKLDGPWRGLLVLECADLAAGISLAEDMRGALEVGQIELLYVALDRAEQVLDLRNTFSDRFPVVKVCGVERPRVVSMCTQNYSERVIGCRRAGMVKAPVRGPWEELQWLDRLAAELDRAYRGELRQAERPWSDVPHDQRENSRALARHLGVKLRSMEGFSGGELPDYLVERLAEIEHQRFCTAKLLEGWQLGPRDNNARTHPDLLPWSALTESAKEKDRIMVRQAPSVAHAAGMLNSKVERTV
jgi:hypothetical protein